MSPTPQPRRPILATAVEVFAERGYAASSVDHLAEAMALDPATFQRRFAGKEDCFLAAYDRIVAVAHGHLAASLDSEAPWPERLAAALRCLLDLIDANPAAARLALVQTQCAGRAPLERYLATIESLVPFMSEGRELSPHRATPPPIVDTVLPAGVAFSIRCQLLRHGAAADLYPELLRFLLLSYLGEAETAASLALAPQRKA